MASQEDSRKLQPAKEHVANRDDPDAEQSVNTGQLGPFIINLKVLPMKLYYLFYFGAMACVAPYLPVFYRYMSMSARQTGVITGLQPFVVFVAKPFWAALADKYRRHKIVMVAVLMVFIVMLFSVVILPRPVPLVKQRICNLADSVNCNVTSQNGSNCLTFSGLKSLQTQNGDLVLHGSCRNIILQCCSSGYLSKFSNCHSGIKCLKASNKTASSGNVLEATESQFTMDYNLLKTLLRCTGNDKNCSGSVDSKVVYTCSFLHKDCTFRPDTNVSLCLGNLQYLWSNLTSAISIYEDNRAKENGTESTGTVSEAKNSKMFILLLAIILTSFFFYGTDSMADAVVVKFLSKTGRDGDFGKQRLWGAVGWGTLSILAGLGIDESAGYQKQSQFLIPFCGFLALNLFSAVCVWKLPTEVLLEGHSRPKILKNLKIISTSYSIMTFLLAVLVFGVCYGMISIYLFWFLQDLGGSHLLMGLSLAVTCVAEIPFMFFAGHLIRIFGYHGILYLTFLCYSIRMLSYSYLSNPWFVLAIEPLQGVTFGAFWTVANSYGGAIAPPGMAATVIGLVGAVHSGLGYIIAGFGGSVLYSIHGARVTFRGLAVTVVVIGALFACSQEFPECIASCSPNLKRGRSDVTENIGPDTHELQGMISEDKRDGEEQC